MSPLRARTGFVALVLVPLLAACGGGASEEPAPSTTVPTITTVTPTGTAGPSEAVSPTGAASPTTASSSDAAEEDQQAVAIADFAFSPAEITVPVGTTVVWTNNDPAQHTVVGDDGLSSPTLGQGDSYEHTFTMPGTYAYACGIHASMTGTVVVSP